MGRRARARSPQPRAPRDAVGWHAAAMQDPRPQCQPGCGAGGHEGTHAELQPRRSGRSSATTSANRRSRGTSARTTHTGGPRAGPRRPASSPRRPSAVSDRNETGRQQRREDDHGQECENLEQPARQTPRRELGRQPLRAPPCQRLGAQVPWCPGAAAHRNRVSQHDRQSWERRSAGSAGGCALGSRRRLAMFFEAEQNAQNSRNRGFARAIGTRIAVCGPLA